MKSSYTHVDAFIKKGNGIMEGLDNARVRAYLQKQFQRYDEKNWYKPKFILEVFEKCLTRREWLETPKIPDVFNFLDIFCYEKVDPGYQSTLPEWTVVAQVIRELQAQQKLSSQKFSPVEESPIQASISNSEDGKEFIIYDTL